jgi:hypothetical protein
MSGCGNRDKHPGSVTLRLETLWSVRSAAKYEVNLYDIYKAKKKLNSIRIVRLEIFFSYTGTGTFLYVCSERDSVARKVGIAKVTIAKIRNKLMTTNTLKIFLLHP